jgi:hypothetical protein
MERAPINLRRPGLLTQTHCFFDMVVNQVPDEEARPYDLWV